MRVLAWMRDHLLATVVCYLVVVAVTVVSGFGIAVWLLAALVTGGSTGALLDGALAVLLVTLLGGTSVALLSLVGIGFGVYARAVTAVSWADDAFAQGVEIATPYGDRLRSVVADVAEPPDSHPGSTSAPTDAPTVTPTGLDRLKAAYVEGTLSEREFERRVRDVLGDGGERIDDGATDRLDETHSS